MLSKYTFLAPNLIRVIGEGADYAHPPIPQSFGPSNLTWKLILSQFMGRSNNEIVIIFGAAKTFHESVFFRTKIYLDNSYLSALCSTL